MNQVRLVALEPEVKRDLRESAGTLGVSGQDGEDADKVNECMNENNGGCQDVCINAQGGYYCACNKGRQLGAAPTLNCERKLAFQTKTNY